jgi:hypothetical protein
VLTFAPLTGDARLEPSASGDSSAFYRSAQHPVMGNAPNPYDRKSNHDSFISPQPSIFLQGVQARCSIDFERAIQTPSASTAVVRSTQLDFRILDLRQM